MAVRWRFHDLCKEGIVANRATLRNRIKRDGFPAGKMTGPNERTWASEEVLEWIESRPVKGPEPRGAARASRDHAAQRRQEAKT
jgi:hypothetical protein